MGQSAHNPEWLTLNNLSDIISAISRRNAGRAPEHLAMKYAKMAESPFIFLRGACHLFYDALPDAALFRDAPLAWCCGDVHFENFGSYKGDNRQVYFDINDYDEAALAPMTWDIIRLLTSIQCGADALNATVEEAIHVSQSCLAAYRNALIIGKPMWVEQSTASGLVGELLTDLQKRDQEKFLDKRTTGKGAQRRLKIDGEKTLPATDAQKQRIHELMAQFAKQQANPAFFEVQDIAQRIAGTSSLGIERFVVLIAGQDSPDEEHYLLDIKAAMPSALLPRLSHLGIEQPVWLDEAERIVMVQNRMQSVNHAFLHAVKFDENAYILRGLQPTEDRVAIGEWGKKLEKLQEVAAMMGSILAWDQLRASGRTGAACADELIAFAQGETWINEMLSIATDMTTVTQQQWRVFTEALQHGALAT